MRPSVSSDIFACQIYFAPFRADNIGIFSTITQQFSTFGLTAEQTPQMSKGSYVGATEINGTVYFGPHSANNIGIFNIATQTFTTRLITGGNHPVSGIRKYAGTIRFGMKIYFVPMHQDNVGVYHPATDTFSTVDISPQMTYSEMQYKYKGAVRNGGKLYFVPLDQDNIGVFQPITSTFTTIATTGVDCDHKYDRGATLGVGGHIYFAPSSSATVGILSPDGVFHHFDNLTGAPAVVSTAVTKRYDGATVIGNTIYFTPHNQANVGILKNIPTAAPTSTPTAHPTHTPTASPTNANWKSDALTEDERLIIKRCLGFFAGSESLVGNNLFTLFKYITDPECRQFMARQMYEECLHNDTIVYICDSLDLDINEVYEAYENIPAIKAKDDFLMKVTSDLNRSDFDTDSTEGKREAT